LEYFPDNWYPPFADIDPVGQKVGNRNN